MDKLLKVAKKLTYQGRKHIAASNFVFPKEKRYPVHDLAHARNALARVAAHGTPAEQAKVRAVVYSKYPQLKKRKEEREGGLKKAATLLTLIKEAKMSYSYWKADYKESSPSDKRVKITADAKNVTALLNKLVTDVDGMQENDRRYLVSTLSDMYSKYGRRNAKSTNVPKVLEAMKNIIASMKDYKEPEIVLAVEALCKLYQGDG